MARPSHLKFTEEERKARNMGWAIKTEGMKLGSTVDKYYDFNLHYFNMSTMSYATSPTTELMVCLLFMKRHNGPSTETVLRILFDYCVKDNFVIELDDFTARMTWVFDCSSNMATTAGSTISRRFYLT